MTQDHKSAASHNNFDVHRLCTAEIDQTWHVSPMKFVLPQGLSQEEDTWSIKPFRARPPKFLLPPVVDKIRDQDVYETEEEDPYWNELTRNGTIPTTSSLRAPPTHIGIAARRDKLIGVTNDEVSRRYMVKLRRDRERSNQAVHRSLENLPIKIRQMANDDYYETVLSPTSPRPQFETRLRASTYSEQIDWDKIHQSFEAIPVSSSVTEAYMLGRKKLNGKQSKSDTKSTVTDGSKTIGKPDSSETYDSKTSGYESDTVSNDLLPQPEFDLALFPSDLPRKQALGFQGHPVRTRRGRAARRKNIAFGSSPSKNKSADQFQRMYQKVMDSNRNIHFVHSSLVTGRRVKRINKLPPVVRKEENEKVDEDCMSVTKLESAKNRMKTLRISLYSPPVPVAPYQSFISENTEYQQHLIINEDYDLGSYSGLESEDEEGSYHKQKRFLHVDIPSVRTDHPHSRDESRSGKFSTVQDDLESESVTHLSHSALQRHNLSSDDTSKSAKTNNTMCSLTDISERGESSLTQTTFTNRSDADVKMSIRINFKQSEDVIPERNNMSEEITVPRLSRERRRRRSTSGKKEQREGLDNDNTFSEYEGLYKESIREVASHVDQARTSINHINQVLPNGGAHSQDESVDKVLSRSNDISQRSKTEQHGETVRVNVQQNEIVKENENATALAPKESPGSNNEKKIPAHLDSGESAVSQSTSKLGSVGANEGGLDNRETNPEQGVKKQTNQPQELAKNKKLDQNLANEDAEEGKYWKQAETFFVTDMEEENTFDRDLAKDHLDSRTDNESK